MLIFQINQKELDKELTSTDWLFWNTYLQGRVQADDYVLLPAFIDYIQDTNQVQQNGQFLVELEETDTDNNDEINT